MKRVISTLCLLALTLFSRAGQDNDNNFITGPAVFQGANYTVSTNRIADYPYPSPLLFTDVNIQDYVTVMIDHSGSVYQGMALDYTFNLRIITWDVGLNIDSQDIQLSVQYDPTALVSHRDRHVYSFTDKVQVQVKVISIIDNSTASLIPNPVDIFTIKSDIQVERYSVFDYLSVVSGLQATNFDALPNPPVYVNPNGEIEIFWPYKNGAEEYELEWTWVNSYTSTYGNYDLSDKRFNFKNNSTRVRVTQGSYKITNIFDNGAVVFRVRAIGRNPSDWTKQVFGLWSLPDEGDMSAIINQNLGGLYNDGKNYVEVTAHESPMNWQFSATYAEGGKKKEVVTYFDGSLRSRQMVTRNNSSYDVLVAETFYDHQGRKALESLPAPSNGNKIEYYENFNKNTSNVKYSRDDFDLDAVGNSCEAETEPFNENSGAANYYSQYNPIQTGFNAYLPEAHGFPFIRTEYTPDNTGRVRREGGVGPDHQLSSGHESKYYYGKPLQFELDRLFGSEAGYARFYKKDMVVDPNGQVSISYADIGGKVVATALSGDNPDNVDALDSKNPAAVNVSVDLFEEDALGKSQMNRRSQDGNSLVFNTTLLVSEDGTYDFEYSVTAPAYTDGCLDEAICFDCSYDLTITITDDCGNIVDQRTATVNQTLDLTCENPLITYSSDDPSPLSVNLSVGNYNIYKELSVNEDAFKFYLETMMDSTKSCFRTEAMFIAEELANVDSSGCEVTCEECVAALGTRDAFVLAELGSEEDWQLAYDNCMEPCLNESKCEVLWRHMLADVSPGGQYGEWYDTSTRRMNTGIYPLSVFNSFNYLPLTLGNKAHWTNPIHPDHGAGYYEPNGTRAVILLTLDEDDVYQPDAYNTFTGADGFEYAYPEDLVRVQDFIFYWQPSWAISLVQYHPEYCYHEWCRVNDDPNLNEMSSEDFDNQLTVTETYSEAQAYSLVPYADYHDLLDQDPYFATGGRGSGQYSDMEGFLTSSNYRGTGYSLFEMAAFSARCPTHFATNPPSSTCFDFGTGVDVSILDKEWTVVKSAYMAEKLRLQQQAAHSYVTQNCSKGINGCIGEKSYNPNLDGITGHEVPSPLDDSTKICSRDRAFLYATKIRRFRIDRDFEALTKNQASFDMYFNTGKCPEAFYLENMLNSVAVSGDLLNSFSLENKPYFVEDMYKRINGSIGSFYVDYTYTPSQVYNPNTTRLDIQFIDPALNPSSCEIRLVINNTYTWAMVRGFKQLSAHPSSGDPYQFQIIALVDDDLNPATEDIEVTVMGTSCFVVNGCQFEKVCDPNEFATDLLALMNFLQNAPGNDLLSTTNVDMESTPYNDYFTDNIHYYTSALYSDRVWVYNNTTHKFYIKSTDAGQPDVIEIDFLAYDPISFTDADLADIDYFASIKPNPNDPHGFYIVAYYDDDANPSTPSVPLTIKGEINFSYGSWYQIPVFGNCHAPVPTYCQQPEQLTKLDLEPFLNDIVTNPPGSTTDLSSMLFWTDYLQGQLGMGSYKLGAPDEYFDSVVFDIISDEFSPGNYSTICHLKIFRIDPYFNDRYDFADIVRLSDIRVNRDMLIDGKAYSFTVLAEHSNGVFERIGGYTSCLPIKDCGCAGGASGGGGEGGGGIEDCDALYATYSEVVDLFNANYYGNNGGGAMAVKKSREEFDCDCYITYINYLMNWGGGTLETFDDICDNDAECSDLYAEYIDAISDFNTQYPAYAVEMDYVFGEACACLERYIDYIRNFNPVLNGSTPLNFIAFDATGQCSDPDNNECLAKLEQYKTAINAFNNDPTRNPNGYTLFMPANPLDPAECDCMDAYTSYLNGLTQLIGDPAPMTLSQFMAAGGCSGGVPLLFSPDGNDTKDGKEALGNGTTRTKSGGDKSFGNEIQSLGTVEDVVLENSSIWEPVYTSGWSCGNFAYLVSPKMPYYSRCGDHLIEVAVNNGKIRYQRYLDSFKAAFRNAYTDHCLTALEESFQADFQDRSYHYTLYYYDQAGNLIRTVPPTGVNLVTSGSDFDLINADRTFGTKKFFTTHTLVTKYVYNSLNQLVKQTVPDHDLMNRWYVNTSAGPLPTNFVAISSRAINSASTLVAGTLNGEGYLYRSDDAGKNWYRLTDIRASELSEVQMATATVGYAIGLDGILFKTTDGGASWRIHPHALDLSEQLNDLYFKDANNGVVVGENGLVMITTDGGSTWTPSSTSLGGSITSIDALSTSTLILTTNTGSSARIYVSGTFGTFWTASTKFRANDLADICMVNSNEGFAAGKDGTLLRTTDGGNNWFLVSTRMALDFRAVYFRDMNKGFAILETSGDGGNIYKTDDGGFSWVQASTIGQYRAFSFYSTDEGYAVGVKNGNGILAHLNANTLTVAKQADHATLAGANLYALHFNSVDEGYLAGDGGKLFMSSNASSLLSVWTDVATGYGSEDFREMYFYSSSKGVMLGESGTMVVKNGGSFTATWNGSSQDYVDIKISSGYVFVVDRNSYGTVWRSATSDLLSYNNQIVYTSGENPSSDPITAVSPTGGTGGFVVGSNGLLFKNTLVQSDNLRPLNLNDVSAVYGSNSAYAAGTSGKVWSSSNSGTNWQLINTGTGNELRTVAFSSAGNGLAGGEYGTLIRYQSGTPSPVSLGTNTIIQDIDYLDASNVALCGFDGLLKISSDAGATWSDAGKDYLSQYSAHNGVSYLGAGDLIVVSSDGMVWNSDGSSLQRNTDILLPEPTDIHTNEFGLGVMTGKEGALYVSDNSTSWRLIPSPLQNTDNLNSGWRISADELFVSDENGAILRSTDGGYGWNTQHTAAQQLNDLAFNYDGEGVAVGDNGTITYSTDGGLSWSSATISGPTSAKLRSVQLINHKGFIAGNGGAMLTSSDAGANWDIETSGTSNDLYTVYFHDYLTGYILGAGGVLKKTIDGGTLWVDKDNYVEGGSPTTQDLRTLAFNTRFDGYFAGDNYGRRLEDEADLFSSFFYYDKLGRLTVSENTRQFNEADHVYTYTLFDYKGRVNEVGEITHINDVRTLYEDRQMDDAAYNSWVSSASGRDEVTITHYDKVISGLSISGFTQDNLRNRVASITYMEVYSANPLIYSNAIHYSYDIHGSIKSLVQDVPQLSSYNRQYLRMDYEYDLISGNLNAFHYQDGKRDQWHHKYFYDADNRIIEVQTSLDQVIWDIDARYEYYRHGPVARTEIGDEQVQGMDYAYTLQEWIKGVNSVTLDPNEDMGQDGSSAPGFAKDAFGYVLGYYEPNVGLSQEGDYSPINTMSPGPGHFVPYTTGSDLVSYRSDFFNGNISMMVTSIKNPTTGTVLPQGYAYQYDQLSRLAQMRAFRNFNQAANSFQSGGGTPDAYAENFTYDANGNILTLSRNGAPGNLNMDDFTYRYDYYNNNPAEGLRSNRLYHVNDAISSGYSDDIDDQGTFTPASSVNNINILNNYGYDELGNLIRDESEEVEEIEWTVSGKVKAIIRTASSSKPDLEFIYDPIGNRIAKIEKPKPLSPSTEKVTWYARDAQGNHLVTYDHHWNQDNGYEHFILDERIIYGTKRLGMQTYNDSIWGYEEVPPVLNYYERNIGKKRFEGTNHLGNVLVVFSDKKLPRDDISPGGAVDYFEADIRGSYDYYSFGSPMPDRTFVPQACSTQTINLQVFSIVEDFDFGAVWPPYNSAITMPDPGNSRMMVNTNAWNDGMQITVPCTPGVTNTLDMTVTTGQNDLLVEVLDPFTLTPIGPSWTVPAIPGAQHTIMLNFTGHPSGSVVIRVSSIGTAFPYPDFFFIDYAAIYAYQAHQQQVCWDEDYRFGFNGKEKVNEVSGQGNLYDYGFRIYNPRLGRFLSVDPLFRGFPWYTPYQFAGNKPIIAKDLDGLEEEPINPNVDTDGPNGPIYEIGPVIISAERKKPSFWERWGGVIKQGISTTLDMIPVVGTVKGVVEGIIGTDLITGDKLEPWERALGVLGPIGKVGKMVKVADQLAEGLDALNDTRKFAEGVSNAKRGSRGVKAVAESMGLSGKGKKFGSKLADGTPQDRVVDIWDEATKAATEVKVGSVSATKFVKNQVDKDLDLLLSGKVSKVDWVFTTSGKTKKGGPTQGLVDYIEETNQKIRDYNKANNAKISEISIVDKTKEITIE